MAFETARALASGGHEAHVICHGEHVERVSEACGVWRHELAVPNLALPGLRGMPVERELYAAVAKYREVQRLHS